MRPARASAVDAAIAAIDWQYSPVNPVNVARYRAHRMKRREEHRGLVARFSASDGYWSLMRYLSELGHVRYLSTDDAIASIRGHLRRLAIAKAADHWSYPDQAWKVRQFRDRLLIARYFSRFGALIWQRDAA